MTYNDTPETRYAYKCGRADYYAITAKGGEAINRFPLNSDEFHAWNSGHQHEFFEQKRFYLAAEPSTIYNFFGIK
jgi:hypothetical protein